MDPNATCKRIDDALSDADWREAFVASGDLFNWLNANGSLPDAEHLALILLGIRDAALANMPKV